ncbi:MAG: hypothetical protein N4A64_01020 [Marinisporobacter sp.]|jgi:hypothetical protein|nr:hypothetical protein [Marinisporobacter sp.]
MPSLDHAKKKNNRNLNRNVGIKKAVNATQKNSANGGTLQNQLGNQGLITVLPKRNQSNNTPKGYERYIEVKSILNKNFDDKKILELLKDEMSTAKKACSDDCIKNAEEAAKKKFGYFGGAIGKYKSDDVGYQFRSHLKEKTRDWTRHQVDTEYSNYTSEKISEVDKNSKLSDEEKNTQKLNLIDEMSQRKIFLKDELYKDGKSDVEARLQNESQKAIKRAYTETIKSCEEIIKEQMIQKFKSNFIEIYMGFGEVSNYWGLKAATARTIEHIKAKASSIGKNAYKAGSKELLEKASKDAQMKRDEIIKGLGGQVKDGKLSFDQVQKDDYKAVEEFIYEKDANAALSNGIKQGGDVKKQISDKIRSGEIVAPNVNKGFKAFASAAVMAVPEKGDTASAEGIIRIPVAPAAYVSIKITGEVERDFKDYVTANLSLGFGGGGTAGIATLHGELGGFIEVSGKSSDNLAKLMSYALYRKARESRVIPHGLTDKMWGMGNKSGETKYNEAEAYGSQLEAQLFGKGADADNAAKIGAYGKLSAEIGDMSSGLGGAVEFSSAIASEYSKASFDEGAGKGRLGKMEKYKLGGQDAKGDQVEKLGFEGKIGGGIAEGLLNAEIELRGKDVEAVTIKGKGTLKGTAGKLGDDAAKVGVKLTMDIMQALKTTGTNVVGLGKVADKKKRIGSDMTLVASDLGMNIKEILDNKDEFGKMIGNYYDPLSGEENAIASAASALSFGITYKWEPGSKGKLTFALTSSKKVALDAYVAGVEMKKGRNLFRWTSGEDMNNFKSLSGLKGGVQV